MHESESGATEEQRLLIGQLEVSFANARAIFHLLAREPLDGKLPLALFPAVDYAMQRGHVLCARGPGGLVGVACWKRLTEDRARQAIAEQRMPGGGEQLGQGDAVSLTLMAGGVAGVIAALPRKPSPTTRAASCCMGAIWCAVRSVTALAGWTRRANAWARRWAEYVPA